MASLSLLDVFPEEVIRVILQFVTPEDNLASIQLLSRRFNQIANESLLWRHYCCCSWQYWRHEHMFREKLAMRASSVDWKSLWISRRRSQAEVPSCSTRCCRPRSASCRGLSRFASKGYDAKRFSPRAVPHQ